MWCFEMILCHMATCQQIFPYLVLQWHLGIYWITTKTLLAFTINSYFWLSEYWFKVDILSFYRFDAKPNQNLIAIRREPLVQLNKDSRNVAVPASTYGENGMIENVPKKLANGVIASENEVIRSRHRKRVRLVITICFICFKRFYSTYLPFRCQNNVTWLNYINNWKKLSNQTPRQEQQSWKTKQKIQR